MKIILRPFFVLLCGAMFLVWAGDAEGQTRPATTDGPGLEETEPVEPVKPNAPTPPAVPTVSSPKDTSTNTTGEALGNHIAALEKKVETSFDVALCRQLVLLHLSLEKYARALHWLKKIEENKKTEELDRLVRLYIDNQLGVLDEDGKSRAPRDWEELRKLYEQRFSPVIFRLKKALFVSLGPGETGVASFGKYEEVKEASFSPGDCVSVYIELENYRCVRDNPESFSVQFITELRILTNLGVKIWEDVNRKPLLYSTKSEPRDMFFTSSFLLPNVLQRAGTYVLQIKVKDLNAVNPTEATRQLTFTVK